MHDTKDCNKYKTDSTPTKYMKPKVVKSNYTQDLAEQDKKIDKLMSLIKTSLSRKCMYSDTNCSNSK